MTAAKRAACAAFVLVSVAALPSLARADAPSGSHADALFREGRTLLDAKRYDEACPKLAEAQKQEPGAGTLLALALCHEGQGKTATAWSELNQAAAVGKGVGRNDLAAAAQKRAQAMEPLLSRLVVRLPAGTDGDYEVKRDGELVDAKQAASPVPVDPGEHRVEVSARGKLAKTYAVRVSGAGVVEIVVDKLDDAPRAVSHAPAAAPISLTTPADQAPPSTESRGGTQRGIGLVIVGLGVVGLGTGAYFGGRALSERSDGRTTCTKAPCPTDANDGNARAKSSMGTSITSLAAGTGAIALGTIIYMLAPSAPPSSTSSARASAISTARRSARVTPEVGSTQLSLGVSGAF